MRGIFSTLTALCFMIALAGCQKEVSYVGSADNEINLVTPDPIAAPLIGNVYNENNQPASGVTVKVGSKTAVTDSRGFFRIENAQLDKQTSLVTAELTGYFKAYRVFGATEGANEVSIKLIKKTLTGTVDASTGGEVSLTNGSKVKLAAGSIVDAATGNAYTGNVQIYASYIDPTVSDIAQTIPGSLMANDKNGSRVVLNSFGMLAVELYSTGGQKLQIKSGMSSTITTAIPASKLASAPASIALWSVDETTGLWKEEGTATKNGSVYVGEATHFSFWNCDQPMQAVQLTVTVQTANGPVVGALVKLTRQSPVAANWGAASAWGYTDSLGKVKGMVPKNEVLIVEVMSSGCFAVVYTQTVGPFTSATTLPAITIPVTAPNTINITGTLQNCSGAPVTSGVAYLNFGNQTRIVHTNAAGQFSLSTLSCTTTGTITAIAMDSLTAQQSALTTAPLTLPTTSLGVISACGTVSTESINYTVDGTPYTITAAALDSLAAYVYPNSGTNLVQTLITGAHMPAANISFKYNSAAQVPGTYNLGDLSVQGYGMVQLPAPISVNVTSYPTAFGQFAEGSFSGSFTSAGLPHTISCTFKVRRLN